MSSPPFPTRAQLLRTGVGGLTAFRIGNPALTMRAGVLILAVSGLAWTILLARNRYIPRALTAVAILGCLAVLARAVLTVAQAAGTTAMSILAVVGCLAALPPLGAITVRFASSMVRSRQ